VRIFNITSVNADALRKTMFSTPYTNSTLTSDIGGFTVCLTMLFYDYANVYFTFQTSYPYYIAAHIDYGLLGVYGKGSVDIGRVDNIGSEICLARLHESYPVLPVQLYLGPSKKTSNETLTVDTTLYDMLKTQYKKNLINISKIAKTEENQPQCPKKEQKSVCQLGNIFNAIPDREFALLVYDSKDCSIYLIFSNQTNAEKLNQFEFADNADHRVPRGWLSLYTAEKSGKLMPVLTTGANHTYLVCAPSNCNRLTYNPITGTNRFDCDFSTNCTVTYYVTNWYYYVNDPRTNVLYVIAKMEMADDPTDFGEHTITVDGPSSLLIERYDNPFDRYFQMFSLDSIKYVSKKSVDIIKF
jgi:hypothetical protein